MKAGEAESLRGKYNLNKQSFMFDELPEPLWDSLILAMSGIKKAKAMSMTKKAAQSADLTR
jgi:hypothetical protein